MPPRFQNFRFLQVCGGLLGAVAVIGLCLPTLMSTPWGKNTLVNLINERIPGTVEVQELRLGWFGKQVVKGVTLHDPAGEGVLTIDQLTSNVSLWSLLMGRADIGHAEVNGLRANLMQDGRGRTGLHQALVAQGLEVNSKNIEDSSSNAPSSAPYITIPFRGQLVVNDGSILLREKNGESIRLADIQALLQHDQGMKTAVLEVSGQSHQRDLTGHFAFQATFEGLDSDGRLPLKPSHAGISLPAEGGLVHLKIDVENAAVPVFDQLLTVAHPAWTGLLADALGDTLNLRLDLLLKSTGPSLEIVGNSANFKAELITQLSDGNLMLERPGIISLKVSPTLFERLWQIQEPDSIPTLTLKRDVTLEFELQRFTIPTRLTQNSGTLPTMRLALRVPDVYLVAKDSMGEFYFNEVSGVLERLEASNALVYQIGGAMTHLQQEGSLRIAGKVIDQDHIEGVTFGDFTLAATKMPSAALDHLFNRNGLFVGLLGENVDLQATMRADSQGREVDLQIGSDNLAAPSLQFRLVNGLQLLQPSQVHMQVTPGTIQHLLGTYSNIVLEGKTSVLVTLKQLDIPLNSRDWSERFLINADLATAPFVLGGLMGPQQGRARFSNVKLQATGKSPSTLHFALQSDISPDGVNPTLAAALGTVSTLEVEGVVTNPSAPHQTLSNLRISLQNELVDARVSARSEPDGSLILVSPATLRYDLKPEVLLALGLLQPQVPHFVQTTPMEVRVEDLNARFDENGPKVLFCRGKATVGKLLVVQDSDTNVMATLRDIVFSWRYDSPSQLAALILRAKTDLDGQHGFLDASLNLSQWGNSVEELRRDTLAKLEINGQRLPLAVVSALTGRAEWMNLVGPMLEVAVQGNYGPSGDTHEGSLLLSVTANRFQTKALVFLDPQGASLQEGKPVLLSWTINPDRWQALQGILSAYGAPLDLPWTVVESASLSAKLTKATLPVRPRAGVSEGPDNESFWLPAALAGTVDWNGVRVRDISTGEEGTLQKLALTFETDNADKSFDIAFVAKELPSHSKRAPAEAMVNARLVRLTPAASWLDPQGLGIDLSLKGKELSLINLLRYPLQRAALSAHLPGLIGQRVSGTAHVQLEGGDGHLQASLVGDSGRFAVDGDITKRILTLSRPLILELAVTPELRHGLLRDVAPYMAAAQSTEAPIRFTVAPQGFSLPVDDLNSTRIGEATLEMGKVKIQDNGQLGAVVSILQGRDNDPGTFNVWFTPLRLSLADGILKFSRMDALIADRFPVALWGKIDLIKDRVRLIIGITGQALREAYSLAVDDQTMLQIPLTGTIDNAGIDKAKTTTRVTALIAQSQGSTQGAVIGGVLDLLGGGLQDEKVPPPNGPLPWENSLKEAPQSVAETRPLDDVKKEVKKSARKLLDALRPK